MSHIATVAPLATGIDREGRALGTRIRRTSQIAFFILFVWLLARTKMYDFSGADNSPAYRVNPFFKLDPLAVFVNALSGRTLYSGLAWALLILIPTFFLGRFFAAGSVPRAV